MSSKKNQRSPRVQSIKSQKLLKSSSISSALARIKSLEREMSQVIGDLHEKVRQLEYLNYFSNLLNSALNVQIVQEEAMGAVCQLLGCQNATVLLVDFKKAELYAQNQARWPIDDRTLAGRVVMFGESQILKKIPNTSYYKEFSECLGFAIRSALAVPLKAKGRVIGVLLAFNKIPNGFQSSGNSFFQYDLTLLETLGHQVAVAVENSNLYSEIKRSFFDTVEALAEAIDKKDRYTGGHTKRVVYYSMCIAKYLNLSEDQLEKVRLGAILHDVGKIGIEDKILKKQSALDPEEWKVMQNHPNLGYDIMARVDGLKDVIGGMRYHHERWDGRGYPLGLKAEEIPLIARIISVADAFDAMASTRPYRKGIDPILAVQEIVKNSGTQFDPTVVGAFLKAFEREKMGKGSGGHTGENNSDPSF